MCELNIKQKTGVSVFWQGAADAFHCLVSLKRKSSLLCKNIPVALQTACLIYLSPFFFFLIAFVVPFNQKKWCSLVSNMYLEIYFSFDAKQCFLPFESQFMNDESTDFWLSFAHITSVS